MVANASWLAIWEEEEIAYPAESDADSTPFKNEAG